METNEIMNNEVNENMAITPYESVEGNSGNGLRTIATIGVGALACVAAYKGFKFVKAKIKSKKEKVNAVNDEDIIEGEVVNEEE